MSAEGRSLDSKPRPGSFVYLYVCSYFLTCEVLLFFLSLPP